MTAGRAALVGLQDRYLHGLLDPSVTLLEAHKLMYFMQEAGEPLRLRFTRGHYGPYAENLGHVLNAIEGHLVSGYADGGDAPGKELRLVPGALDDALAFLHDQQHTQARFERASELVEEFESPFGLERLSTAHWLSRAEGIQDLNDIIDGTYSWNSRKRQFSRRQIGLALGVLEARMWVDGSRGGATPA